MRKIKINSNFFLILISVVVFYFVADKNLQIWKDKKLVLKDYSYTEGWIIDYWEVGKNRHRNLRYEYFAEGKLRRRTIDPDVSFPLCIGPNTCRDRKFVVLYSNSNPSISLIDLHHEISDLKGLKMSDDLLNFFE